MVLVSLAPQRRSPVSPEVFDQMAEASRFHPVPAMETEHDSAAIGP